MLTKKLLIFGSLLCTMLTHQSWAMQTNEIYPINNGLRTRICGAISSVSRGPNGMYISSITIRQQILVDFICYESSPNKLKLFYPLVLRGQDGLFEVLGQFDSKKHKEAIDACLRHRAIFWNLEQGVLIYSLEKQPCVRTCMQDSVLITLNEYAKNVRI